MLDVLAAHVMGAIVGSLAIVNFFIWAAGAKLSTGRQVWVTYTALGIASAFAMAVGNANGGPPNFDGVGAQLMGVLLAALIQAGYLGVQRRSQS